MGGYRQSSEEVGGYQQSSERWEGTGRALRGGRGARNTVLEVSDINSQEWGSAPNDLGSVQYWSMWRDMI